MKNNRKQSFISTGLISLALSLLFTQGTSSFLCSAVNAKETAQDRVANTSDDAKRDSKKSVRKFKKNVRDATGQGSASKDMGDSIDNASDSVSTGAKKLKRKVD